VKEGPERIEGKEGRGQRGLKGRRVYNKTLLGTTRTICLAVAFL